jgi:hypothetical protein
MQFKSAAQYERLRAVTTIFRCWNNLNNFLVGTRLLAFKVYR